MAAHFEMGIAFEWQCVVISLNGSRLQFNYWFMHTFRLITLQLNSLSTFKWHQLNSDWFEFNKRKSSVESRTVKFPFTDQWNENNLNGVIKRKHIQNKNINNRESNHTKHETANGFSSLWLTPIAMCFIHTNSFPCDEIARVYLWKNKCADKETVEINWFHRPM